LTRFKAHIIRWESEPVQPAVMDSLLETAVALFNHGCYVSCVSFLNGIEVMDREIAAHFVNFDLLRAIALYALDMKDASLTYLHRELESHDSLGARSFLRDYFKMGVTTDVQKWCAERADQFDLQIVPARQAGAAAPSPSLASTQNRGSCL
jgi:hypothetical protein